MPVRPVRARISKTKKPRKIQIGINVSQGTSKWSASFQLKMSRSSDVEKLSPVPTTYTYAPYIRPLFFDGRTYGA